MDNPTNWLKFIWECLKVIWNWIMGLPTDEKNLLITIVYAVTTIGIFVANCLSTRAQQKALEESKDQFHQSSKAQQEALEESKKQFEQSVKAQQEALEESKKQFEENIKLQMQNNYDSVRPAVSIHYFSAANVERYNGKITISNHGIGPAIIKGMNFKNDQGKYYKNENGYCTVLDLINQRVAEEQMELDIKTIFLEYYSKEFRNYENDPDLLGAGETLQLLKFEARNREEARATANIFRNMSVELVYTDIYGSRDWTIIKRLTYFVHAWKYLGRDDEES